MNIITNYYNLLCVFVMWVGGWVGVCMPIRSCGFRKRVQNS